MLIGNLPNLFVDDKGLDKIEPYWGEIGDQLETRYPGQGLRACAANGVTKVTRTLYFTWALSALTWLVLCGGVTSVLVRLLRRALRMST